MQHGGNIEQVMAAHPQLVQVPADYSANISPFGMPKEVAEAAMRGVAAAGRYPDPDCSQLRRQIAASLGDLYQAEFLPAWIVCGNGAADLIFRVVQALRPKKALLCSPTFGEYEQALRCAGTQILYADSPRETLQAGEEFLSRIRPGIDLVFFCNPNNPTGCVAEREFLLHAASRCARAGAWLCLDECFLDFYEKEKIVSLLPFLSQNKHILVLKSFTKMFAMAGLRLGYAVTADEELANRLIGSGQPWPVSTPAVCAGCAALKLTDYPQRVRTFVTQERTYLTDFLRSRGIRFFDSKVNYILFQIREPADFFEQMLTAGFLIRGCANYRNLDASYYRIAVRGHDENVRLTAAMDRVLG